MKPLAEMLTASSVLCVLLERRTQKFYGVKAFVMNKCEAFTRRARRAPLCDKLDLLQFFDSYIDEERIDTKPELAVFRIEYRRCQSTKFVWLAFPTMRMCLVVFFRHLAELLGFTRTTFIAEESFKY